MVNNQNKIKGSLKDKTLTWYLQQAILLLGVVALGLLAVNQAIHFTYSSAFLKSPCGLCADLNPAVAFCIDPLKKITGPLLDPAFIEINLTNFTYSP